MNWKQSLDKYLTTEPDDGFDDYVDNLIDKQFSDKFYNDNEDWIQLHDGLCNKWMNKLFNKGINTPEAAQIIERAFALNKVK